jgi:hypothetical protein
MRKLFTAVTIMFQPTTLLELSLYTSLITLDDARSIELLPLPLTVKYSARRIIKSLWVNQQICLNPERYKYHKIDLNNMCRVDFNMLMNYNYNLLGELDFIPYSIVHVCWGYILWKIGNVRSYRICISCYKTVSKLSGEPALANWGIRREKWRFFFIPKHMVIQSNGIFEHVIKKQENFCDICILNPLFEVIKRSECISRFKHHDRQYTSDESSDTSSGESHEEDES